MNWWKIFLSLCRACKQNINRVKKCCLVFLFSTTREKLTHENWFFFMSRSTSLSYIAGLTFLTRIKIFTHFHRIFLSSLFLTDFSSWKLSSRFFISLACAIASRDERSLTTKSRRYCRIFFQALCDPRRGKQESIREYKNTNVQCEFIYKNIFIFLSEVGLVAWWRHNDRGCIEVGALVN